MKRVKLKLVLIVLLLFQHQVWAKQVKKVTGNSAVMIAEAIAPASCTLPYVKRLSMRYLRENPKAKVLWLGIFTDKDVAVDVTAGKGRSETTFQQSLNLYRERNTSTRGNSCAELVKVGSRASLRFLGRSGKPVEIAIARPSPFQWEVAGRSLELVYVGFSEVYSGKSELRTHLYFRSKGKVDLALGQQITDKLSSALRSVSLVTHIRQDDWFVSSSAYPWVNPFISEGELPTWESYKIGPELYCNKSSGSKPCMENVGALVAEK